MCNECPKVSGELRLCVFGSLGLDLLDPFAQPSAYFSFGLCLVACRSKLGSPPLSQKLKSM